MERPVDSKSPPRRVTLNPCDYHLLLLQREGGSARRCRYSCFIVAESAFLPSADALRLGVRRLLATHPVFASGIRFSLATGRPFWRPLGPDRLDEICDRAIVERGPPPPGGLDSAGDEFDPIFDIVWNYDAPPLFRLDVWRNADGGGRICLRWAHVLMDAEGGLQLLRALVAEVPAQDGVSARPLVMHSPWKRWQLFRAGWRDQSGWGRSGDLPEIQGANASGRFRLIRRLGTLEEGRFVLENARRGAPAGPGRYGRFFAACVLRALHQWHVRRGSALRRYVISYPMGVDLGGAARPMNGNYFVSPFLAADVSEIEDQELLARRILEQVQAFLATDGSHRQWALLNAAAQLRASQYGWLMRRSIGRSPIVSGFSYYAVDESNAPSIAGATVEGVFMGAIVATPPGWNPVFVRYGDQVTFTLAWVDGPNDEAAAAEYADLIIAEAMRMDGG